MRLDAVLTLLVALLASLLLISEYLKLQNGYTGTYDCYRAVNNEALRLLAYVSNPNSYTSTRFRATFYYSNGTTIVRGASMPRAQCYTYLATNDNRGVLVLVKVEG
jgi:hypothetical protein